MQEITITIAPLTQGIFIGCLSAFVFWGLVVLALIKFSTAYRERKGLALRKKKAGLN